MELDAPPTSELSTMFRSEAPARGSRARAPEWQNTDMVASDGNSAVRAESSGSGTFTEPGRLAPPTSSGFRTSGNTFAPLSD